MSALILGLKMSHCTPLRARSSCFTPAHQYTCACMPTQAIACITHRHVCGTAAPLLKFSPPPFHLSCSQHINSVTPCWRRVNYKQTFMQVKSDKSSAPPLSSSSFSSASNLRTPTSSTLTITKPAPPTPLIVMVVLEQYHRQNVLPHLCPALRISARTATWSSWGPWASTVPPTSTSKRATSPSTTTDAQTRCPSPSREAHSTTYPR